MYQCTIHQCRVQYTPKLFNFDKTTTFNSAFANSTCISELFIIYINIFLRNKAFTNLTN